MKYQNNIIKVAALQPDYLGFIFYKKSVRHFNSTIPHLPKSIKKVGVFVDAKLDNVFKKIQTHNLQAIQLHGNETPEYCSAIKIKNVEVIKVFSIQNPFNFDVLKPYESACDYYLFDSKGELPGGNGFTFDWSVLNNYPSKKPFFLSGGIGLNEIEKIKEFQQSKVSKYCFAIDVNSKFEIKPGLKDIEKLYEFKNNLIF